MTERRAKYGNVPSGGYDSKLEAEIARTLDLLMKAGKIYSYSRQVPFELIPRQGRERAVSYVADFLVWTQRWRPPDVVVEAKGYPTPLWRLKRRLFLWRHPQYRLVVARRPEDVLAVVE